ncbi:MAG: hypothetical protein R3C32_12615 [Chloroflexota bacterium]
MADHSTPYLTLVGFRWQQPTASQVIQANIIQMIARADDTHGPRAADTGRHRDVVRAQEVVS